MIIYKVLSIVKYAFNTPESIIISVDKLDFSSIKEAKLIRLLKKQGFGISESDEDYYLKMNENFYCYYYTLDYIKNNANSYNDVIKRIREQNIKDILK